jgi:hypothetical protein
MNPIPVLPVMKVLICPRALKQRVVGELVPRMVARPDLFQATGCMFGQETAHPKEARSRWRDEVIGQGT